MAVYRQILNRGNSGSCRRREPGERNRGGAGRMRLRRRRRTVGGKTKSGFPLRKNVKVSPTIFGESRMLLVMHN